MSRLQELIEQYCPDGVEYKALGEVGVFLRGSSFQKKHFVEDGTPCIHYGQVHTRFSIATDAVVSYLDEDFAARMKHAKPGDLIIATTAEDDEAAGKAIAWLGDTEVVVSNDAYIYRHELDPKYMAYVFASDLFQEPKRQYITGTKVRRLNERGMSKIVIPVPPIEVQREVVRILDEYTTAHDELVRRLEEEVSLRDNQCQQAHDKTIYDAMAHTETTNLGRVCLITDGDHQPPPKVDDGIPFVTISCIDKNRTIDYSLANAVSNKYYNSLDSERKPRRGDVLMTVVGTLGVPVRIEDEKPFAIQRHIAILRPSEQVHQGFLYHYIRYTDFHDAAVRAATGSAQKTIGLRYLRSARFPKLTYMEQESLAHRLDNIEESFSSMKESLYSEIDCLDQQLQLVRNQLLSFPEKVA